MGRLSRYSSPRSLSQILVAVVIIVFLAVQVPVWLGPPFRPASLQLSGVSATASGGRTTVSGAVKVVATRDVMNVRVVVAGLVWVSRPATVYLYCDPSYPLVGSVTAINGFMDHLGSELRARNLSADIHVLGATDLATFLQSNASGILVVATTALPVNVFGPGVDLLTPWIRNGGTLIWIGELIGGFSVTPGVTPVEWNSTSNLQWSGEMRLFGTLLVSEGLAANATGSVASPVASTLDLGYNRTADGADLDELASLGGLSLGWVGGPPAWAHMSSTIEKTSIASIHVGDGTVLLFGYAVAGPSIAPTGIEGIARDVAQILASGVLYTDYRLTMFRSWDVPVGAGATLTQPFQVVLNGTARAVSVLAFAEQCGSSAPAECSVGIPAYTTQLVPVG